MERQTGLIIFKDPQLIAMSEIILIADRQWGASIDYRYQLVAE